MEITYSISLATPASKRRAIDAMIAVFEHLEGWKRIYNIDFVSCIVNGAQMDITMSDAVPKPERDHIRLTVA